MIRRLPAKHRNARVPREKDNEAFLRLGLLLAIGLGLACGFVYAGRQHFVALRYGYETENLRRERDQLAEQQRRLILQREEAASPVKLEQAAKRLGISRRTLIYRMEKHGLKPPPGGVRGTGDDDGS